MKQRRKHNRKEKLNPDSFVADFLNEEKKSTNTKLRMHHLSKVLKPLAQPHLPIMDKVYKINIWTTLRSTSH